MEKSERRWMRCRYCQNRENQGKGVKFFWTSTTKKDFICNPCLILMMEMMDAFKKWANEKSTRLATETE